MVEIVQIDDPDDPRVADYMSVRDRDVAGRSDAFVAEGEVVVRTLLSARSRFRARSVLAARGRLGVLDRLAEPAAPGLVVYEATRAVMDRIVGFPIHRGILAIGSRQPELATDALLPPPGRPARIVGLVGLANHDNVGALFRNAAAFGVDAVLLDATCCDPLYRKAIRVSTGACLTVPFGGAGSADDLIEALAGSGLGTFAFSPSGAETLGQVRWPERAALVFGPEGTGLPPNVMERCRTVRIEMAAGHDSLNVGAAAAVALHAARLADLTVAAGRPN